MRERRKINAVIALTSLHKYKNLQVIVQVIPTFVGSNRNRKERNKFRILEKRKLRELENKMGLLKKKSTEGIII
jgi:hypothetical protein